MNTDRKIHIGVLFGGRSGEHEVSLMSARSVLSVLDPNQYTIIRIGITHEGDWFAGDNALKALQSGDTSGLTRVTILPQPGLNQLFALEENDGRTILRPYAPLDVVFPVLHGTFGEDGTLQGLLEMADLAYVGGGVLASSVGMDKALFKDVMRARGIRVVPSLTFTRRQIQEDLETVLDQSETISQYPLFVKPVNLGSSVGVSKCRDRHQLRAGLLDAARYDRRILVEMGVNGREIEVSVLGNDQPQASIPGEILPAGDFYSYESKYIDERSELIIPASLDEITLEEIRRIAVEVYRAMDGAGMARIDFLLDRESGIAYVNEANTIPGFTKISMYPKLWDASGLSYQELVDQLIAYAVERKQDRDQTVREYGSAG
jgi:D-alanine-D-alanine ligase